MKNGEGFRKKGIVYKEGEGLGRKEGRGLESTECVRKKRRRGVRKKGRVYKEAERLGRRRGVRKEDIYSRMGRR